jgi:hypothetical protein
LQVIATAILRSERLAYVGQSRRAGTAIRVSESLGYVGEQRHGGNARDLMHQRREQAAEESPLDDAHSFDRLASPEDGGGAVSATVVEVAGHIAATLRSGPKPSSGGPTAASVRRDDRT